MFVDGRARGVIHTQTALKRQIERLPNKRPEAQRGLG